MSILAEPRRKQKFCLNPRGKEWSEDSSKFGQKMLEKMGWSNGKGLGAHLDGVTEHVKISYKNDSKGMGFKESNDQWTGHEDKFAALLQTLGDSEETVKFETDKNAVRSLEKKSQNSRARVHYHKFTRGKDLSRYSQKDLANIFGRKTLEQPEKEIKIESELKEENGDEKQRFGVETVTGGSMVDYFKKKFNPNFMNTNGFKVGSNGVLEKCESGSDTERSSFGFGFSQSNNKANTIGEYTHFIKSEPPIEDANKKGEYGIKYANNYGKNVHEEIEDVNCNYKKSKKNKKIINDESTFISYVKEDSIIEENEVKKSKKKKKSKKDEFALSNPAFDPTFNEETTQNDTICEEGIDEHNVTKKSKKKKRKLEENILEECSKSKKIKKGIENACFDNAVFEDAPIEEAVENPYEIKQEKKMKKSKIGEALMDFEVKRSDFNEFALSNPAFDPQFNEEATRCEESVEHNANKMSKNKRKFEENSILEEGSSNWKNGIENTCFDDSVFEDVPIDKVSQNPHEVQKKIRQAECKRNGKKNENKNDNNQVLNEAKIGDERIVAKIRRSKPKNRKKNKIKNKVETFEIKPEEYELNGEIKRRKKKSRKIIETGADNPCLETNLDIACDFTLNVTTEPIIITPVIAPISRKSAKVERRKSVRFSEVNEERIIPNNEDLKAISHEDIEMRNELFEINRQVIERGTAGFVNNGFNLKGEDGNSFFESSVEMGQINAGFDNMRENVEQIEKTIDSFQAEVENDLNEAKIGDECKAPKITRKQLKAFQEFGGPVEGGVILRYRGFKDTREMPWQKREDQLDGPKKSYKNLITGDTIMCFPNSNLHLIEGYAEANMKKKETLV